MTQTMNLQNASSTPTKTYDEHVIGNTSTATTNKNKATVFNIDACIKKVVAPVKHTSIDDLVDKWSKDEKRRKALEEARLWYAEQYHADDGVTVRTMRLKKQWSQTQLAAAIGSSQPHVARIERGTENLTIDTCRKLCAALDVDMNILDAALKKQETLHKKPLTENES